MLAAILVAALVIALARRARGTTRRGAGACAFFLMPLIAYSSQELIERLLHAESFPFQAALEPRFLLGLALQLPFALAAFALGWLLLRLGTRLLRLLARHPQPALPLARAWTPQRDFSPPIPALARGHPLRGPPLLA